MKIYLVGGAIRNRFLFLPVKEKDWVVVGSSSEEMLKLGFKKVGKFFPVFIHPISNEEYALARTEIKIGHGHNGFDCFSLNVSIEEDLYRRDITINAIAEDKNGKIIDPYFGIKDIENKLIKHISNNFKDDPLRVLRVARFYSYLYHLKFKIFDETLNLMKLIVKSGELSYLSSERILQEIKKSMLTKNPEFFFYILNKCKALYCILPEFFNLLDINSDKIKNFYKILKVIKKIKYLNLDFILRFYSLIYILIIYKINELKLKNFKINYSKFILNKKNIIISIFNRFNLSKKLKIFAIKIIDNIFLINKIELLNEYKIVKLFHDLNINKNIKNLFFLIQITFIYKDIRIFFIDKNNNLYNKNKYMIKIWKIINSVDIKKIIKNINNYKNTKEIIINEQVNTLKKWIKVNNFKSI
ncbi:hypothetical protein [endosymbiont of Pachyrhynchus infernalis]|uniref:hypothetical protein n=1 Tax=endosymbiont of Pachyrhynchus infernalis TaxID=1971488 RepID=UPI000DC6DF38|nr:hypothetical protein [endosymbiont of Pachyrhynchus infernalis]BBA84907.1 multifunctional CCA protein [endosymbiont of Pachyrhynchus infernalis]